LNAKHSIYDIILSGAFSKEKIFDN